MPNIAFVFSFMLAWCSLKNLL